MPLRLTTSVLVRRNGKMIMFDAGEGIQLALKRGGLGIRSLDAVAITHLHADHVLGLPGILMFRAQNENPGPLTIVGPPGIGRFIKHTMGDLRYRINFELNFVEWHERASNTAWTWNGARLDWEILEHSTLCLGYRLEEPFRPGKFHYEQALELGVPEGPLFGRLQAGDTISTPEGRQIKPDDVLGPPRRGRVMAFATDTRPCPGLERLLSSVDLAFVEGMFTLKHENEALEKKHMTSSEAAYIAAKAGVERLILVHISPRYSHGDEEILENEAREQFENAEVAKSLASYEIPLPD
ncbi:MAG: ribonuclease Z [Proteobacteria bacterium]|nr:ribonuclease Z [Pseudomonadota bacterium]